MADYLQYPQGDYVPQVVERALAMSRSYGEDIATAAVVPENNRARVRFVVAQDGVICGIPVAREVLAQILGDYDLHMRVADGTKVTAGTPVLELSGNTRGLLEAGDLCCWFLSHLSGIASKTAQWAEVLSQTKLVVRDTLSVTPGLGELEKYAVRVGGGMTSRLGIGSFPLIRATHLRLGSGLGDVMNHVRAAAAGSPIQVEIDRVQDLDPLLKMRVELLTLRGFSPEQATLAADHRDTLNPGTLLEVAGDLNIEEAGAYGECGVDYLALNSLTDTVTPLSVRFEFV
ncbi:nicotinate-nucleotide diphosphorylase [Varibaculum vaginae]|uniref:nicotinate-nucleotide diphosphorylase n=1 Tax=Varibaculum vaginae TaxID=2364797 RepID=UPI000F088BF6|nr:nicotinate-nucleotide diphosphorylase (carboxylating) [Varibaculum vaginae]